MRRVVAEWWSVNVVELVPVKTPVADEFFSELLVVSLHLRHGRAECGQATRHVSVLAILVKNEPLGMFFHDS
jgi:hypothetical protein